MKKINSTTTIGTRFYTLYDALTLKERQGFLDFLKVPFFNTSSLGIGFVDYLLSHKNKWEQAIEELKLKEIEALLRDKKQKGTLVRLFSDLAILLKLFYAMIGVKKNKGIAGQAYLKQIVVRQKNELLDEEVRTLLCSKEKDKCKEMDEETYYYLHSLSLLKYYNPLNPKYSERDKTQDRLIQANDELEKLYCIQALKIHCEIHCRNHIANNYGESSKAIHFPLALIKRHQGDKLISLFYNLYQLLENGIYSQKDLCATILTQLKDTKTEPKISIENKSIAATLLMNHYSFLGRKGDLEAYKEYHNNSIFFIKKGILLENNIMRPDYYLNLIITGIKGGVNVLKLEEFQRKYSDRLTIKDKKITIELGNRYLLFYKGKFKNIIRRGIDIGASKNQINFYLRNESLTLRACYEIMVNDFDYETIMGGIKRFRRYLAKSKELSPSMREGNTMFLNILERLADFKYKKSTNGMGLSLNELEESNSIVCKSWLKEKIEELQEVVPQ